MSVSVRGSRWIGRSETSGAQIQMPSRPTRMARLSARRKRVTAQLPRMVWGQLEAVNMHRCVQKVKRFLVPA
jgi:hypothetical protein